MQSTLTEQEYIAMGDAAWKAQDWKTCLDNYSEAIRINPNSKAVAKRDMVNNIISFYHKDMLNP